MATMKLTPETQVSTIVAAYPVTLRMFESLGIDYCCGGKKSLKDAAADAKVPVETVIAVLETSITQAAGAPGVERNWQDAPIDELMRYIVDTHHKFMYRELARLDEMMGKVVRAHGPKYGDVLRPLADTFAELKAELSAHLKKEEDVTFPAINRLLTGVCDEVVRTTVRELELEHEHAGQALERMRTITHGYVTPTDACATYCGLYEGLQEMERDLHQHIHLENNILFPRVQQLAETTCRHAA